ncbi:MAG: hypothetical protein ACJ0BB_04660 [Dehalococcoidia bacterium]
MIVNFDFEKSGTAIITFVDQLQSNISYLRLFLGIRRFGRKNRI